MIDNQVIEVSDHNEILSLIWKELDVKPGQKALDVGIGTKALSASGMLDQKLEVVGIDTNPDCLAHSDRLGIPVHICDASHMSFDDGYFDISIAFFTLHEVDPKKHSGVISEMKRVSNITALVEPLPNTGEIGMRYDKIWQDAMESVDRFEIYRSLDYWTNLVSELNPKKLSVSRLRLAKKINTTNAESFCNQSIEHFKKIGIDMGYRDKMKKLEEDIKKHGMNQMEMAMVIGFFI